MNDGVADSIWTGINVHNSYGQADYWWLRSPNLGSDRVSYYDYAFGVDQGGDVVSRYYDWHVTNSYGRRPALISIRCSSDSCNFMYHYVFFV